MLCFVQNEPVLLRIVCNFQWYVFAISHLSTIDYAYIFQLSSLKNKCWCLFEYIQNPFILKWFGLNIQSDSFFKCCRWRGPDHLFKKNENLFNRGWRVSSLIEIDVKVLEQSMFLNEYYLVCNYLPLHLGIDLRVNIS